MSVTDLKQVDLAAVQRQLVCMFPLLNLTPFGGDPTSIQRLFELLVLLAVRIVALHRRQSRAVAEGRSVDLLDQEKKIIDSIRMINDMLTTQMAVICEYYLLFESLSLSCCLIIVRFFIDMGLADYQGQSVDFSSFVHDLPQLTDQEMMMFKTDYETLYVECSGL